MILEGEKKILKTTSSYKHKKGFLRGSRFWSEPSAKYRLTLACRVAPNVFTRFYPTDTREKILGELGKIKKGQEALEFWCVA